MLRGQRVALEQKQERQYERGGGEEHWSGGGADAKQAGVPRTRSGAGRWPSRWARAAGSPAT